MKVGTLFTVAVTLSCIICFAHMKVNVKNIISVDNIKHFKKVLKIHTNVLAIYSKDDKSAVSLLKWTDNLAKEIKGKGTIVYINCGENKEAKKLCKKYNVNPRPKSIKHYKDGNYNKDYDRKEIYKSMLNFMLDPTGDAPWDEDASAKDVVQIYSEKDLNKLRRKEKGQLLIMFYAPWCGYCKKLKPDFAAAATELKGKSVLGGMDVDKPHAFNVRYQFNITAFPTIIYFEKGEEKFRYSGKYDKQGIIDWLSDPQPESANTEEKDAEAPWSSEAPEILHITDATFDESLKANPSVMIMFYAPWCGHCKNMKPEFVDAAKQMKEEEVSGTLSAVDCTKETETCKKFDVSSYPTVKYFQNSEFKFNLNTRTKDKIIEFMKNPEAPPPPPKEDLPWPEVSDPEVLHLEESTFKEELKKRKHVLVMFYAPWCGHCKTAKPEVEAAASHFKDDRKVWFAGVDCIIQVKICERFDVTGFPTFRYFLYGKKDFAYNGGRTAADFIDFMKDPSDSPPPSMQTEPEWKDTQSAIVHLEDDDFEEFLKTHTSVFVMFYAPWCGHCKSMKPAFTEAANELLTEDHVLAAVDCTQNRKVASKYEIAGYPTIKHFKDGVDTEYQGGRSKEDIIQFLTGKVDSEKVKEHTEPTWADENTDVKHLDSKSFNSFVQENPSVLVVFYAPWCGFCKRLKPAYGEAAKVVNTEDQVTGVLAAVDCTANTDVCNNYGIQGYPTLKYFKNGYNELEYDWGREKDDFINFMKDPRPAPPKPVEKQWSEENSDVSHLTDDTFESFIKEHDSVLVMFYAPWCGHCNKMKPSYGEAAKRINEDSQINGKLAALDCTTHVSIASKYEVKSFPTLKYFKNGYNELEYDWGREKDDFINFMKDPRPAPPKPVEKQWSEENSDVSHLTDDTFESFIKEHDSVLVMFYAPWCGHCNKMKPSYGEAAKRINEDSQINGKLAALDCTTHVSIASKYEVKGFPTLKYFKNGKEVAKYHGERTADAIIDYMKNGASPAQKEWKDQPSDVHHLTDETFTDFVKNNEVLVMFYAPWCGHCSEMKPAYMETAKRLKEKNFPGVLAAVEATKERETAKREGTHGYPTLKYYSNGKFIEEFEDHRTVENLENFMEKMLGSSDRPKPKFDDERFEDLPSSVTHLNSDNFKTYLQNVPHAIVMFHIKWCKHCSEMRSGLMQAAARLSGLTAFGVAAVNCDEQKGHCNAEGLASFPAIKYYSHGKFIENYSGVMKSEGFVSYLQLKAKEEL